MNKIYTFYSLLACLVLSIGTANAYTFTWNGGTSTEWSNSANWTRTGTGSGNTIPGASDDVVINNGSATNQPTISGTLTILNLTMSAGVFNLDGATLTVTNNASFTGGTVRNGWIDARDFTNMSNTTFDADGNAIVLNKTAGGSANTVAGGNTFIGPFAGLNSSAVLFRLAGTNPDIYQGYMHYEERSSGQLEPAYSGNNIYPAEISTQGSSNPVSFAMGATGKVIITDFTSVYGSQCIFNYLVINNSSETFNMLGSLSVNTLRHLSGNIDINGFTLTVSTSARFLGGSVEDGILQFTNMDSMQNTSFSAMSLIKIGGGNNTVRGGNTFNGDVIIRNNDGDDFRMANVVGDDFNGDMLFLEMGAGELQPAYNGNNTFGGNISTIGSNDDVTFGLGNGWVIIDGNTTQGIAGDGANQPEFERIRMNTSGTLAPGGVDINIIIQLDFVSGLINTTSSFMVHIYDNATVINAKNSSHVVGPVRKTGNDAFTFPVGDGTFYAPISIGAPTSASHWFIADYTRAVYSDLSVSGLDHVSTQEFWNLNRNNGAASNVRVTLSYNFDRSGPINKRSDLRVARFNGTDWVSEGLFDTTGTPGNGTITSNVVTAFSPFTLGSSSGLNPLPITLLSFNAIPVNTSVIVKWITTNEQNNDFFTVEKSFDGRTWFEIGVVDGAENSNLTLDYQLIDRNPVEGLQFYRLKQTDLNGEFTYSSIVPVKFNSELKTLVYPQPAGNIVNVSLQNNENQNVSITVYSTMGQKLIEMNQLNGNNFQVDISQLNTGVYYMEVSLEGVVSKMKLIKQ